MGMDMPVYAGASYLAYVHANIEATGVKYLPQEPDTASNHVKVLVKLFFS
jgi:hypothetical protein